jgi:hypothetical protein
MTDPTNWEKLQMDEPLVRDVMAIERTTMANDRTFLVFQVIGWIFVPTGIAVFIQGIRVYRRMNKRILRAEKTVEDETKKKEITKAGEPG